MAGWTLWLAFNLGVVVLLALDLGLVHRRAREISLRWAAIESAAWVVLSLAFGTWIYFSYGRESGLEFFTGYVVEKSQAAGWQRIASFLVNVGACKQ